MTLDIRTMLVIMVLGYFAFGLLLLGMWRLRRSELAMRDWSLANFASGLGMLLIGLRDFIPAASSIALGNGVVVLGQLLMWAGVRRFAKRGRPIHGLWLWLLPLAVTALFHGFEPVAGNLAARIGVLSASLALISALMARDAIRAQRTEALFMRQVFITLSISAYAVLLLRTVVSLWGVAAQQDIDPSFMAPDRWQSAMMLLLLLIGLMWNVSLLLMAGERLELRLMAAAHNDALTDVLNRGGFLALAGRQIERCRREGQSTAVLLLDLDHFKTVNDVHGHDAGDRVLCAFAETVRAVLRPGDLIARRGGEEFCVLLANSTLAEAGAIAERIRSRFEAVRVPAHAGTTATSIATTVSIGVAAVRSDEREPDAALARADRALYAAKRLGRNRVEAFADDQPRLAPMARAS